MEILLRIHCTTKAIRECEYDDPYSYLSVDDFIDGELAVLVTTFIGCADFTLLARPSKREETFPHSIHL